MVILAEQLDEMGPRKYGFLFYLRTVVFFFNGSECK